jgi:HK97 family phage portal protein
MGRLTLLARRMAQNYRSWSVADGSFDGQSFAVGGSGRVYWLPQTGINWDRETGDLWECPAFQACLNWMVRNALQAPPVVRVPDKAGEMQDLPDHPLTALLKEPNPYYDWTSLLFGLLLSWEANGNAYCGIERDRAGRPAELYWLRHDQVRPMPIKGSKNLIDYYEYRVGGRKQEVPVEDMLHCRFGIDPADPRRGLAPAASSQRGVYTLQGASNYGANIMRNFGTVGAIVSTKEKDDQFDVIAFGESYRAKTTGDHVGDVMVVDTPLDIQWPKSTPQDMALETVQDRPEADVCALLGVPPQVVGLHVGRLSKTYANMKEAREAAWEECIMPNLGMLGQQIGHKLLPQMQPYTDKEVLAFDFSKVRPLQPDKDAMHLRVREDYKVGMLDRAEARAETGREVRPEDAGVYYSAPAGIAPAAEEVKPPKAIAGKSNGHRTLALAPVGGEPREVWAQRVIDELGRMEGEEPPA